MKNFSFLVVCLLCFAFSSKANNLTIGTTTYSSSNQTLTFTVAWDNSWSISAGPSNWDAVWIFVKRQNCSGNNNWVHQLVSTTSSDHLAQTGGSTSSVVAVNAVSDGMGVFVRRIGTNVVGSVAAQTITLKLASTNPSITTSNSDNFEVIGVEMVYVPQGQFYLGDGRPTNTNNFSAASTNQPLLVNATVQANGLGTYSNYVSNPAYGCSVPLPSTFPTGYNGYYCMKYEIQQGLVVEFLNTISYDQQARVLAPWGRLPNVVNSYIDENWYYVNTRVITAGTYNTVPAVFYCAYPFIPQTHLNWTDLTAILDWAGLRPMTEFEYEKACRGPLNPVAYEYPWGSTTINYMNNGNNSATAAYAVADGYCHGGGWNGGPIRSGFAAGAATNRSQAGATYYGILDMAGQVYEQCIGGGNGYNYSTFTTVNGDGVLTANGAANVANWPSEGGVNSGTILKGGFFNTGAGNYTQFQISDRQFLGGNNANRSDYKDRSMGGRGVRSF
jgi:formylglycine-generating enzyme required for sulfatase activity